MHTRRTFLGSAGASLLAPHLYAAGPAKKKLAVVTTLWADRSHAWHMAERFLHGYPVDGKWHTPPVEVVSAFVDQKPEGDLSAGRAKEFGFKIYPTIDVALCRGGKTLAVDAVLLIGEHGKYDRNEFNQIKYPRFEFFKQITDMFARDGRAAPVFNDKHLSYDFTLAKKMVDLSKTLKFPFLAGSSLPVTWRMPDLDMPHGAEVEEVMCVAFGGQDVYDFHAHETIQCMAERRKGGETGVVAVQGFRGANVWKLLDEKGTAELFAVCLARSQTLAQPTATSHRYPTLAQMKEWVKEPIAHRVEYKDGLRSTMLLLNGLVKDFNFAARIKGQKEPLSVLFHLPPTPNVTYSAALMSKAEEMFVTGNAPYPVERTLLTSGINEAGLKSLAGGEKRLETPHLAVKYDPPARSQYWRK
ncbi:MAG: hypothetical protein FJ304_16700 [Planctomycetes bacterium]|nr:hypothetical protein [Planctomycetota bacterium]